MGGGGGGGGTTVIRYADYIEEDHKEFLTIVSQKRNIALENSPFENYADVSIEEAFFSSGYSIASFPSLYDMYGKFMAGLDIEILFNQSFEDTLNGPHIGNLVSAEADLLDDDIESKILPRYKLGLRNVNAVVSSSFVVGESLIESARVKAIAKYSAELKYRLLPIAVDRWKTHLSWNQQMITQYTEIMKLYFMSKMDIDNHNFSIHAQDTLWPFTILEYQRAALGAMQGATNTESDVAGASKTQKVLGGVASGAATGAMVGGPWGALVGGIVGGIAGALM